MCRCTEGPRPLYRVSDLTTMTGLSRQTIHRMLARNEVRTIRYGRGVLVPLSSLRTMLPELWDSLIESSVLNTSAA